MPGPESIARFEAMEQEVSKQPEEAENSDSDEIVLPCGLKKKKQQRVRLVIRNDLLEAYGKIRYELTVGSESFKGTIDESRIIDHLVQPRPSSGTLKIWRFEQDPKPLVFELEFNKLLPTGVPEGVEQRLTNLGFDCTNHPDESSPGTQRAMDELSSEVKLQKAESGSLDDFYSSQLKGGSPEDEGLWADQPYKPLKRPASRVPGKS